MSTSSFLLHTPAEALRSTITVPSHYMQHQFHTRKPPSILYKKRLGKQQRTTTMQTITTTQLRGDQQPQIDEFVPLDNQPVTIQPIYYVNDRDKPKTRILSNEFHIFCPFISMFSSSSSFSSVVVQSTNVSFSDSGHFILSFLQIPALEPGLSLIQNSNFVLPILYKLVDCHFEIKKKLVHVVPYSYCNGNICKYVLLEKLS